MASFDCPAVYMYANSDEGTQTLSSQTGTGTDCIQHLPCIEVIEVVCKSVVCPVLY